VANAGSSVVVSTEVAAATAQVSPQLTAILCIVLCHVATAQASPQLIAILCIVLCHVLRGTDTPPLNCSVIRSKVDVCGDTRNSL
jgi:hypothetical protein